MSKEDVREKIFEIEQKMKVLEWDIKHSQTFSKKHIYEKLKQQREALKANLVEDS